MKRATIVVLGLTLLTGGAAAAGAADAGETPAAPPGARIDPAVTARAKMAELDWLIGTWKGSAWTVNRTGGRDASQIEERATRKADGQALLLEGRGTQTVEGKTRVTHDAVGLILWNGATGTYQFTGTDARGHGVSTALAPVDGGWRWGYEVGGGMQVRFTIRHTGDGRWHEQGEIGSPDGTWRPMMEMTLTKVE